MAAVLWSRAHCLRGVCGFTYGLRPLTAMDYIEFNFSRNDGGEWFHPDQQVL